MTNELTGFIGREGELQAIHAVIARADSSHLVSVQGQGGVGKTFLLRKIHGEYSDRSGFTCFPIIDFSQGKTRTRRWLMDTIVAHAPGGFQDFCRLARYPLQQAGPGEDQVLPLSEEDLEQAFFADLQRFERQTRCIFLFDTLELVQDTLLFDFILTMARSVQKSVVILAGRRNEERLPDVRRELGMGRVLVLFLDGFDEEHALEYIGRDPAGARLEADDRRVLYLLSERGIPIKLALALDWLSRGWIMETLDKYSYEQLQRLQAEDPDEYGRIERQFELELVTQIAELGTYVDQVIYRMAHVHKRFNRALLELLVRDPQTRKPLPKEEIDDLVERIPRLPFVKRIEEDYFVLHDEVQRMIAQHIWQWRDAQYEERNEINRKVIGYYDGEIARQRGRYRDPERDMPPEVERECRIYEIERLHYQLNINLVEGYQRFSGMFEELEDRRDVELAALALDVVVRDRTLPSRLRAFIDTYHRGWVLVRRERLQEARQHIEGRLPALEAVAATEEPVDQRREFIEREVDRRIGEIHTLLGYCHRLLGDWEEAIEEYERACDFHKRLIDGLRQDESADQSLIRQSMARLAETLNDIANLQRMHGNLGVARRYCKMSLIIRERLKAGRAIGHCCYVMGMIMWESGNTSEAMHYLERARRYYRQAGDERLESAWVDRYEGYMMFRTGSTERALSLLKQALDATFDQRGLQDEYAEILLHRSRIFRNGTGSGSLAESLQEAESALEVAQKVGNDYRIAEAYLTQALTRLRMLGRPAPGSELPPALVESLRRGIEIARRRQYRRLEVVFAEIEADIAFAQDHYIEAFDKYTLACRRATQFKPAVFARSLSDLANRLQQLIDAGAERTLMICERILGHWTSRPELVEDYPELVDEVSFIQEIAESADKRRSLERDLETAYRHGSWDDALYLCDELSDIPIYNHPQCATEHYHRAEVYHGQNRYAAAHIHCQRALRIRATPVAEPGALGDSYLLLSRIYWKLGNTAEAADVLDLAQAQYKLAKSPVGLASVDLERAFVFFRTHQFKRAGLVLDRVQKAFRDLDEPVLLASAMNLMSRLSRIDPQHEEYREIGYREADRRGKEALQVLADRDWFVAAEINLSLCILHYIWGLALREKGQEQEAQHHLGLSRDYNASGWEKIEHIDSPTLHSVYRGMDGNLLLLEGRVAEARSRFLEELVYAAQTKHMRLLRALDLLENWLVSQPPEATLEDARWFIDEWAKAELADRHPEVVDAMQWMIEYRRYVLDAA